MDEVATKRTLDDIVTITAYKEKGWIKPVRQLKFGKLIGFRFAKETGLSDRHIQSEFLMNVAAAYKSEYFYNRVADFAWSVSKNSDDSLYVIAHPHRAPGELWEDVKFLLGIDPKKEDNG